MTEYCYAIKIYNDGREEIEDKEEAVGYRKEHRQLTAIGEIENGYVVTLKESSDERAIIEAYRAIMGAISGNITPPNIEYEFEINEDGSKKITKTY